MWTINDAAPGNPRQAGFWRVPNKNTKLAVLPHGNIAGNPPLWDPGCSIIDGPHGTHSLFTLFNILVETVSVKDGFFYAECPLACHYFSDRHFGAVKVDFEAWIKVIHPKYKKWADFW